MSREEIPISRDQMPEEARQYMDAIQSYLDHPFVAEHFFQVTWLTLKAGGQEVDFFALEFHVGRHAALIWHDGEGNWGAGPWLRLAHPDADITCPPTSFSLDYFQHARANPSLGIAINLLVATQPTGPL